MLYPSDFTLHIWFTIFQPRRHGATAPHPEARLLDLPRHLAAQLAEPIRVRCVRGKLPADFARKQARSEHSMDSMGGDGPTMSN